MLLKTILIFTFSNLFYFSANAEPWLANRYAQNCAACHSPSRRNVETKDRRCTLNCQGCHTNPSGGGIRNEYGVWNQNRWLKSIHVDDERRAIPAPLPDQLYGKMPEKLSQKDLKKYAKIARRGPPLKVIDTAGYNSEDYDKLDMQEHITVQSKIEQMARMADNDPYRTERDRAVFAGADFRYFMLDGDTTGVATRKIEGSGPMVLDFGVKYRPVKEHFAMVFESRYYNNPTDAGKGSLEYAATSGSQIRSMYALYDDLPYNLYVQYGLYKPQFGHTNPDHSTLLNHMIYADNKNAISNFGISARSAKSLNKVLSIGGSPNVPFFNLHWIQPMDNYTTYPMAGESGYAANIGLRFVTLGASIMLSNWSTKGRRSSSDTEDLKTDMVGVTGGISMLDSRIILNADWSSIKKEFAAGSSDKGDVLTLEGKLRMWREMYLVVNSASSNTTRSLKEGKASEMMYGIKTFLWPQTELEVLMVQRDDRDDGADQRLQTDMMQAQLHLFF